MLQIPSRLYNSAAAEPFLNGSNAGYVEEMYNNWLRDPASVHAVSALVESVKIVSQPLNSVSLPVMGRVLPQQFVCRTSVTGARAQGSRVHVRVPRSGPTNGRWLWRCHDR